MNVLLRSNTPGTVYSHRTRSVRGKVVTVAKLKAKEPQVQAKPEKLQPISSAVEDNLTTIKLWPTSLTVPRIAYTAVEWGVVVATLAAVDAAYSGDWSRIGVITVSDEAFLQRFLQFAFIAHGVTSALSVWLAVRAGYSAAVAAAKGFAFGTLGLIEVHQICEAAAAKQSDA